MSALGSGGFHPVSESTLTLNTCNARCNARWLKPVSDAISAQNAFLQMYADPAVVDEGMQVRRTYGRALK